MPEFECLVNGLLSQVEPKQTCFRLLWGHHPISKLLKASDKAFELIILDNELHACDQQKENSGKELGLGPMTTLGLLNPANEDNDIVRIDVLKLRCLHVLC